ncbi:MarR family transcriptional regulator [Microlunatus endophyticus]|uniref:MarR family transcriptional regulator n=1 Tax=Microlunatus endophyticus TaxID=1716077 RepID=A0A917S7I8_9ACTN|nr:MarR family winged helix-turn-helix transcriptional regulator [Microlunatus endophyticus]GGL60065.1 MarR family transcriptional regulator [Microlunatus endophyticus]
MAELGVLTEQDWEFWDAWVRSQRLLNREFDRALQQELALSKADFSVLVTLEAAPEGRKRVGEVAEALDWDKGRVAHQLTRMESRCLLAREEDGAPGRRTGVRLTATGWEAARRAVRLHSENVRRLVLDRLAPEERAAIAAMSCRVIRDLDAG